MEVNLISQKNNLAALQPLTNAYVKIGSDIDCRHYSKVGVFVNMDVNDSTGIILKAVGHHTLDGTDYEIDGLSTVSIPVADSLMYYEFETGAIPFLELQIKATVVGATAGILTSLDITKSN